jgi:hypothetical protein
MAQSALELIVTASNAGIAKKIDTKLSVDSLAQSTLELAKKFQTKLRNVVGRSVACAVLLHFIFKNLSNMM